MFAPARTRSFIFYHSTQLAAINFYACFSFPETITSLDVNWRYVCINIMNTDDSKNTWQATWPDGMLAANLVQVPFWLADQCTKFSTYT